MNTHIIWASTVFLLALIGASVSSEYMKHQEVMKPDTRTCYSWPQSSTGDLIGVPGPNWDKESKDIIKRHGIITRDGDK